MNQTRILSRELPCGLVVSQLDYQAEWSMGSHAHSYDNVTVHYAGDVWEETTNGVHHGESGSVVVKPAGTEHSNRFGEIGSRTIKVVPGQMWLDHHPELAGTLARYRWHHSGVISALGFQLCREFVHWGGGSAVRVGNLFAEIIKEAAVPSREKQVPHWVDELTGFLKASFRDRVRVREIAEAFEVHPVYLARIFRRKHGCTIPEFLCRLRLEWATKRLASADRSLAEIALEAGFADQSHFSRQFRRTLGLSPGELRTVLRAKTPNPSLVAPFKLT